MKMQLSLVKAVFFVPNFYPLSNVAKLRPWAIEFKRKCFTAKIIQIKAFKSL